VPWDLKHGKKLCKYTVFFGDGAKEAGSKSEVKFTILLMSPTQAQVVLPLEF